LDTGKEVLEVGAKEYLIAKHPKCGGAYVLAVRQGDGVLYFEILKTIVVFAEAFTQLVASILRLSRGRGFENV